MHDRGRDVRRPCTCSVCRAATCSRFLTGPAPVVDPCSANEARSEDSIKSVSYMRVRRNECCILILRGCSREKKEP